MPRLIGPAGLSRRPVRPRLRVEPLEDRTTPSAAGGPDFQPVVVAGDPRGTAAWDYLDPDSPDQRVDPNVAGSRLGGVGAVTVKTRTALHIGTGSAIGPRHVLTAAHVLDLNGDGKVNSLDKTLGTYFVLNLGGNQTHRIAVSKFTLHPDFTGFNNPAVNDDLAVLTLARALPAGTPIYPIGGLGGVGTQITVAGYGRSGDGLSGYTTLATPDVKRVGMNVVDAFYGQDDAGKPEANEIFRFDFDGPDGDGPLGRGTLGNTIETTLGPGDSGGPAFTWSATGGLLLAGINTFTQGSAPFFGSMAGGINLGPYLGFLRTVLRSPDKGPEEPPGPLSTGGGGIDIGARPVRAGAIAVGILDTTPDAAWAADPDDDESEPVAAAPTTGPGPVQLFLLPGPLPDSDPAAVGLLAGGDLIAFVSFEGLTSSDE